MLLTNTRRQSQTPAQSFDAIEMYRWHDDEPDVKYIHPKQLLKRFGTTHRIMGRSAVGYTYGYGVCYVVGQSGSILLG